MDLLAGESSLLLAGMKKLVENTMATQAHTDLWAVVQQDLRLKLGEDLYEYWVAPLRVLSQEGDEIRLGAANRFVLEWIEKRYLSEITSTLSKRSGEELRVQLVIDPAQYQDHRRKQEVTLRDVTHQDRTLQDKGLADVSAEPRPGSGCGIDATRLPEEQTLESFIVGSANKLAYNAALAVLERPGGLYNPLFLFGPSGVGKTHLLKGLYRSLRSRRRGVFRREPSSGEMPHGNSQFLRVSYLTGEQFFHHYVASIQDRTIRKFQERYRSLDVLILDDVHLLVNKRKTQLEFLHTFSALADSGRQIILACDVPPRALLDLDKGLVGRFSSGLVVSVKKPEYATRLGIARAQARRLSSSLDDAVLQFVAETVCGNAREIAGAVKQLHHHSQLGATTATSGVDEAREVLAEFIHERERRVDLKRIHHVVAGFYRLTPDVLVSGMRQRSVAFARQVAMFLARRYTRKSLAEVGKYFGKRNHTTVKCAEAKIGRILEERGQIARDVAAIVEILEE